MEENIKMPNICIIGFPDREEKKIEVQKVFKKWQKISNLAKDKNLWVLESEHTAKKDKLKEIQCKRHHN